MISRCHEIMMMSSQMCLLSIFTGGGSFQNTDHAKLAHFPFSPPFFSPVKLL